MTLPAVNEITNLKKNHKIVHLFWKKAGTYLRLCCGVELEHLRRRTRDKQTNKQSELNTWRYRWLKNKQAPLGCKDDEHKER